MNKGYAVLARYEGGTVAQVEARVSTKNEAIKTLLTKAISEAAHGGPEKQRLLIGATWDEGAPLTATHFDDEYDQLRGMKIVEALDQ